MRAHALRTEPVSMEMLLRPAFFSAAASAGAKPQIETSVSLHSYTHHNRFLAKYKDRIKVFADVGCDLVHGAPTTVTARQALGPQARVHAVDIFPPGPGCCPDDFKAHLHSIVKAPLPFKCDALRLANVLNHLPPHQAEQALRHSLESLNEGGFLLGATHGEQFFLQKVNGKFQRVVDW
ncbi:MAG TPA: hypothetical protein HA254_05965 [Candidatus Diapherotrites archaeon]|uniref:Class I SAM-dependent methyltransferase n=1 Tax=Candidatus Iainarchaeum sp. TaxID=3101447 RepID=A0A7J4IXF6_9ARCH|nr:hypothetical protein [Candidatus Diapherotrites archaeon]